MQYRRTLALGVALSVFAPLVSPPLAGAAYEDAVTEAAGWLVDQQQADGGFELAGFPGFETSDAIFALGAAQPAPWDTDAAREAVSSVQTGGLDAFDAIDDLVDGEADPTSVAASARAAKVAAIVAIPTDLDPMDFDPSADSDAPVDLIARIEARRNGADELEFGAQFNGLLYAVIAYATSGRPVSQPVVAQIVDAQRDNGSWDFSGTPGANGDDVDTTALALTALGLSNDPTADDAIDDGVAFLAAAHQPSGAWQAFGSDDPNSTALATMALSSLRLDPTSSGWRSMFGSPVTGEYVSPQAFLTSQQGADGRIASPNDGYGINTFATSQAMEALGTQWYLAPVRVALVESWSADLASPAAGPVPGAGADDAEAELGGNPSLRADRAAGATAVVNGQDGREAAAADLFAAAFGRPLDPSGRAYWSNQLRTLSRPEVLARLTGSSEYYRRAGGTIPAFVDRVYQSVLGRTPDPGGRAYWIRQVEGGRSVQAVARSLTASSEYRRKQVTAAYQRVLDRAPSVGERDFWTARVATTRIEVLLATLASSTEHYWDLKG